MGFYTYFKKVKHLACERWNLLWNIGQFDGIDGYKEAIGMRPQSVPSNYFQITKGLKS